MTSINAYSVSLAWDASSYINSSRLLKRETRDLTRQINTARSPADNYARSIDRLDAAYRKGAIDLKVYNRLVADADSKFRKASRSAEGLFSKLSKIAGAYVGFRTVKGIISSSIGLAADAEQTSVAFKVMLGDAEAAGALLSKLSSFAVKTPFQLGDIQQSGRQLLAFGFSAKEVLPQLTVLGNLAAGTGQSMSELADLVGKARVQNTIFSEDLNQLTGRGINVFDGLANKLGTTTDQVKKFASEGKISFSQLNDVLKELSETKFGGLMAEQSETLKGQWSSVKDDVAAMGKQLGEAVLPALKKVVAAGRPLMQQFSLGLKSLFEFGDVGHMELDIADRLAKEAEAAEFTRSQLANKDAIRAAAAVEREKQAEAAAPGVAFGGGLSGAIGSALTSGLDTLKTGAGGLMDVIGAVQDSATMIALGGKVDTQELIKSLGKSPEIASLEAGTQEAYAFLNQATTDAAMKAAVDAENQKRLAENQVEWQRKTAGWLEKINTALEGNGFKRLPGR